MADIYRDFDALLFPTRLEGLSLAAIEAQACGLPVLATQGSSLPEVVVDGKTGLLCSQDDPADFATAARQLAADAHQWAIMSANARKHAVRQFNVKAMIDHYIEAYHAVVNGTKLAEDVASAAHRDHPRSHKSDGASPN